MSRRHDPTPAPRAKLPAGLLFLTAVVSGAAVMVIEVMGSRVIGPLFGVSVFVWTALITVTLVALAAGYAAGGVLADRRGSPDALYAVLLLAGLAVLVVPAGKSAVLKACAPLGLRSGALLSSALLFGPSLFLLGCVSPLMVRIAARELRAVGRTVGMLYALSTVGSFAGTLLAGFVLVAFLGVGQAFAAVSATLVGLAAAYFVLLRRRWPVSVAAAVPLAFLSPTPLRTVQMANGTTATELARRQGFYGTVQVIDYTAGSAHTRELVIDGLVQGGVDVRDGLSVYEFAYFLQYLPYGMSPSGERALVVGLGGGIVPMWYQRMGVRVDVVEINPEVVRAARDFFGFRLDGELHVEDARRFLVRSGPRYDYVLFDAFTGDLTPSHLLTVEALRDLRARLAPGGIVAFNLAGSLKQHRLMTASVIRTLEQVFPSVQVFPVFDPEEGEGFGNMAIVVRDGPRLTFDRQRVAGLPVHPLARREVERFLGRAWELPRDEPALVLTDDYNPMDVADVWLRERVRRGMMLSVDWDILT